MNKSPELYKGYENKESKNIINDTKKELSNILKETNNIKDIPYISDEEFIKLIPNEKEAKFYEFSLTQIENQKTKEIQSNIKIFKEQLFSLKQEILNK